MNSVTAFVTPSSRAFVTGKNVDGIGLFSKSVTV
jgi:hypothetical protein